MKLIDAIRADNVEETRKALKRVKDINREMVAEGFAWAYRQYLQGPYASEYISQEERARSRRAGLWHDANPQPPWEFRAQLKGGDRRHRRH